MEKERNYVICKAVEAIEQEAAALALYGRTVRNYPPDFATPFWRDIVQACAICDTMDTVAEQVGVTVEDLEELRRRHTTCSSDVDAVAACKELRERADRNRPDLAAIRKAALGDDVSGGGWVRFPLEEIPSGLRSYIEARAEAIGCDPAMIMLPCLSVLAGAVGSTRAVEVIPGSWTEMLSVWSAVIADSGSKKSPALDAALWPVRECQAALACQWREAKDEWESLPKKDRPEKPPVMKRVRIGDATAEAVARQLSENPRGLILSRDELTAWIGGMSAYKPSQSQGTDFGFWLSLHSGKFDPVDRVGKPDPVFCERPALSLCGTIQPGIFKRDMAGIREENGMLARMLVAAPPTLPRRWLDKTVHPSANEYYVRLVRCLFELEPEVDGTPVILRFSPEARREWEAGYNRHGAMIDREPEGSAMRAHLSKLEAYAVRLAGLLELLEQTAEPTVSADSVRRSWTMIKWFEQEARRVYGATVGHVPETLAKVYAAIRKRPAIPLASITQYAHCTAKDRDEALEALTEAGLVVAKGKCLHPVILGAKRPNFEAEEIARV